MCVLQDTLVIGRAGKVLRLVRVMRILRVFKVGGQRGENIRKICAKSFFTGILVKYSVSSFSL